MAHTLGCSWPIAFVLGAVLARTDAAAVAAVANTMPGRILTVLRAESPVNDGTALVLLAVTIEVVSDAQPFSWSGTAVAFVESYAGGILIGAAVALLLIPVRRWLPEPLLHSVLSVATHSLAYLPAELLHVSGVLAVVACGLVTTWFGPRVIGSDARIQAVAFWEVASYLLSSALFILVGIQLPAGAGALTSVSPLQATIGAVAVSVAVIGTRLLWFYPVPYPVRFLDRRSQQRERRITAPQRLPLAWAGMRGAISLAAALTLPAATAEGHVVEQRDAVVFITTVVIVVTLAFPGPTLPTVVRRARFPEDEGKAAELTLARCHMSSAALRALPELAQRLGVPEADTLRVAQDIEDRTAPAPGTARRRESVRRLNLALLQVKRDTLTSLRDAGGIDDIVLRAVQEVLDVEEVRLRRRANLPASEFARNDAAHSKEDDASPMRLGILEVGDSRRCDAAAERASLYPLSGRPLARGGRPAFPAPLRPALGAAADHPPLSERCLSQSCE
ncbi:cation:proton antiporter [Streptomyces sp. NPDC086549]|uniref:cation:proton antiporter domain-containing protein n=1 Tax=Streptomyces sp. NPDC086549 TaxID=3365752 RepID=UPI003828A802